MLRFLPGLMVVLAGCTGLTGDDAAQDEPTVPIAAILSEYPGQVTVVVEVLQADGSTPPRQVYQFISSEQPVTPEVDRDPKCGSPTDIRITTIDAVTGNDLRVNRLAYGCDGVELLIFIDDDGSILLMPFDQMLDVPWSWQRGEPLPPSALDDDEPSNDDEGGDESVASFPNVSIKEATAGVIQMEHLGGDCIAVRDDYTFRVNDDVVTPRTEAQGGSTAQDFCVGDKIYFDGEDRVANEVLVIDDEAQSQVYKKTIQM